ncbi:MAG: mercury(II) reductase [Devosiaceae bacterium]|nr:mercury(II) reductase [Devosiaceae bacterium]
MSNSSDFDLIVIGAGSAGFSAAITAADANKKVALLGHGTIGGTCVNVGCVPSKTMIRAAEAVHGTKAAMRFPGLFGEAKVENWENLIKAKDQLVDGLRQKKYVDILPQYPNITYVNEGAAKLVTGGAKVDKSLYSAPKIIIATGSRPSIPDISGLDKTPFLDSTGLLALTSLPKSLIFIGGGYIGAELAQMMARFGVKVTMVFRSSLLPGTEPEISQNLSNSFEGEGIKLFNRVSYKSAAKTKDGVILTLERFGKSLQLQAQHLVVTAGREANTNDMSLEEAGVELDAKGSIIINSQMQTSNKNIYGAGDVTNRDQFVYMAAYGAKLAAKNAVLGESNTYDNSTMPWVVFTDPQIGGVGLSEAQAREAGYEVKTSVLPMDQVPRALAARNTNGLIKLIADKKTDKLLGGQISAPEGADSIQTLVMALKFSMTAKDLGATIFPYLTNVEGLKLAAQTFDMDVAKLSCCAG